MPKDGFTLTWTSDQKCDAGSPGDKFTIVINAECHTNATTNTNWTTSLTKNGPCRMTGAYNGLDACSTQLPINESIE